MSAFLRACLAGLAAWSIVAATLAADESLAQRPRIHDLAYSLAFMVLALGEHQEPERFAWQSVPRLCEEYEAAAKTRLTEAERRALLPYTAAVPLYSAAIAGFTNDPAGLLRARQPFLRLSAWLLAHPEALMS